MMKQKVIRDAVHGYVAIDEPIFQGIIDTVHFQRLRRIEQTSMRPLYPSARHDRFIHSIGTYFLGKTAIHSFHKNIKSLQMAAFEGVDWPEVRALYEKLMQDEAYWQSRRFNFCMACLLHDVGHSPFSHTLEGFYLLKKYALPKGGELPHADAHKIENKPHIWYDLAEQLTKAGCEDAYRKVSQWANKKSGPAAHEILSATLAADKFYEPLVQVANEIANEEGTDIRVDIEFIARCIMGIGYPIDSLDTAVYAHMDNCLMKLLNGTGFDVDRLDYLLRDVRTAGYDSSSIDSERLLNALTIEVNDATGEFKLALNKSALSVIESFINAYNDLYIWVYGHHKVCYYTELTKQAAYSLDKLNSGKTSKEDEFLKRFFSYENISEGLVSDDDIWIHLKKVRTKIWQAEELLCRGKKYRSVWKSSVEFRDAFYKLKAYEPDAEGASPLRKISEIIDDKNNNTLFANAFTKHLDPGFPAAADGSPHLIFVKSDIKEMRRNKWGLNIRMPNNCCTKFVDLMEPANEARHIKPEQENAICFYAYAGNEWLARFPQLNTYKAFAKELLDFYNKKYKYMQN